MTASNPRASNRIRAADYLAWKGSASFLVIHVGLMPARSSAPPKPQGGPLSYLSTVTTASDSDWGSQSMHNLSQQPSDLASTSTADPIASTPAPVARATANTASSSKQRVGAQGSGDLRQELGRKLSSADQSSAQKGRADSRRSRDSADASAAATDTTTSRFQGTGSYNGRHSVSAQDSTESGAQANGDSSTAAVHQDKSEQIQNSFSGSQPQLAGPATASATTRETEAADWGAFGGAATNGADHQPQPAQPSESALEHRSGHDVPVSDSQHEWSAFGDPSSASFDAALPGLDDSSKEAAQAGAGFNTNPFLEPGQDPWQRDSRATPANIAEVARMASGDSFGDFNLLGRRKMNLRALPGMQ